MFFSIICQQIVNTMKLAFPLAILYLFYPRYFFNPWAIALWSFGMGVFVAYKSYVSTQAVCKSLCYVPSEMYMRQFEDEIARCGLQDKHITVRYAYVDDGVAIIMFNTVVIDQMVWKGFSGDQAFIAARGVVEQQVIPTLPENKKKLHARINEILSPMVQNFIFRHELGHIARNYSNKRIALMGIMGALVTSVALASASAIIALVGGSIAFVFAVLVGACVDLGLAYASNVFFKVYEEKMADLFAIKFSSAQEIEAAADFFQEYGKCGQEYRGDMGRIMNALPTTMLNGYLSGPDRARFLRDAVSKK